MSTLPASASGCQVSVPHPSAGSASAPAIKCSAAVDAAAVKAAQQRSSLVVLGLFEDQISRDAKGTATLAATHHDAGAAEALAETASADTDFKAAAGSGFCVRVGAGKFAAVVGLGPREGDGAERASAVAALGSTAAARALETKSASAAVVLPSGTTSAEIGAVARSALAAAFVDKRYKKDAKEGPLAELCVCQEGADAGEAAQQVANAKAQADGVVLARELVDGPPNAVTPSSMAAAALMLAERHSDVLQCKILEAKDCEALGMGAYLSVAAAGAPPKFIHLTYTPPSGAKGEPVALVGKGLTFDSGGYNIKAGAGSMIEVMKFDMGGSAAVLGACAAISGMKPEGPQCHFIVASCENMISWNGMRPGDVLTASNGKTIEVNNTDAEGRLTLADALVYATRNCGAKKVVDIATLTGACIVALGDEMAGLFTPSDGMASELVSAGAQSGETLWRMPMRASYKKGLKSSCADMKNTGPRAGGSITAALFLNDFIEGDDVQWAHVDMAGPVWNGKTESATGFGVMTLANWVVAQKK